MTANLLSTLFLPTLHPNMSCGKVLIIHIEKGFCLFVCLIFDFSVKSLSLCQCLFLHSYQAVVRDELRNI